MNQFEAADKPTRELYPQLFELLKTPGADALLTRINELEKFTDYAIYLMEEEGILASVRGWESLRQHAVDQRDLNLHCKCLYCESNAYMALGDTYKMQMDLVKRSFDKMANVEVPEGEVDPIPLLIDKFFSDARTAWMKQRELLFRLSTLDVTHDSGFESAFLCNYGNCLSHVGRTPEAMYRWWKSIQLDSENAAALVSYGQGCLLLGRNFPRHSMLLFDEAYLAFTLALSKRNTSGSFWGPEVFSSAIHGYSQLLEWWKRQGLEAEDIEKRITARDQAHKDFEPSKFIQQIGRHGLLLTVAPRPLNCPSTSRDDAFPEATGVRTVNEQQRLVNLLNTIKEDFSLSRFFCISTCENRAHKFCIAQ